MEGSTAGHRHREGGACFSSRAYDPDPRGPQKCPPWVQQQDLRHRGGQLQEHVMQAQHGLMGTDHSTRDTPTVSLQLATSCCGAKAAVGEASWGYVGPHGDVGTG